MGSFNANGEFILDPDSFLCLCHKKTCKKDSSEYEGYVFCNTELSKEKQDEFFELYKDNFLKGTLGSENFLKEAERLTGRIIKSRNVDKMFGTINPLSYLFFFTMRKCHFEINWNHLVNFLVKLNINLSDLFKEQRELAVDLCFSDKHLIHVRKGYTNESSLLLRSGENDRFVTLMLNFLLDLKKNASYSEKIFCGKDLNSWISELKSIGKRIFNERNSCTVFNCSYVSRIREKNLKNLCDSLTPIVSVNNCGTCGIPLVNLPVSEHASNLQFFANTITVFDDDDLNLSQQEWEIIDELERASKKAKLA